MAISSWIKGRRYKVSESDLSYVSGEPGGWLLPVSYAKFIYPDGSILEIEGMKVINGDDNDIFVSNNDEGYSTFVSNIASPTMSPIIEFIYDYDENNYEIDAPSNNVKPYATLLEDRSLVAIYKESTGTWVNLPCPTDYSGLSTTVVDSARNTKAQVVGQVVATDIAKVELYWNFLTVQQYSNIAKLFEPKHGGHFFVPVSYFDEVTGEFEGDVTVAPNTTTNKIRLMYPGDRKAKVARIRLDNTGKPVGYEGVSLNLIDTGFIFGEEMV